MKRMSDASDASRVRRRRIMIGCIILCAAGVALNIALWVTGHGNRWTVILFCIEFSGLLSGTSSLRSMRGQR